MPETLEHAKMRARNLLNANKPVEAICALTHCLNGLGVPLPAVAEKLKRISSYNDGERNMVDGVRLWVDELEA